ncbi:MAG: hypothetical protein CMH46_09715 [Muricauda sp.]|nr:MULTISPECIES: DUF6090 family protein [unclassified Allomuricauda]MAU15802.1 hypothetical protein [Allomuricauda sp.]|tara:strand:- start:12328 stop:13134 length:807 start_codon:yes stop_codon:yes gene_type:complete
MIKFFRRIRKKLLSENKFSKYLIYAIGEIILVVIGILIALSINNWNEKQKDLAQEQLILKQLQREYTSNLNQLDEKILMRNEGLEACQVLLNYIDRSVPINANEFYKTIWQIIRDPTFDPIVNDIIGSEKLRLIQNQELVELLSNWSSEVYQVQELELQYQKFRSEIIVPCSNRLGITRNVNDALWKDGYTPTEALDKKDNYKFTIGSTKKKLDLTEVISDVELEGIVTMVITFYQMTNMQSQTLRERIKRMLSIIENEIEKNNEDNI